MKTPPERLNDSQVDALSAALQQAAQPASGKTFHNYGFSTDPSRTMGVMRVQDHPRPGLTTSVTFGLAHESWTASNFPHRIELLLTWQQPAPLLEPALVVVAETICLRQRLPKPGVIYEDAFRIAEIPEIADRMPHALVMFPYQQDIGFERIKVPGAEVWFFQIVPLYEDEKRFIEREGFKTFEEILEHGGAYFDNPRRRSHIITIP
jgi:hypothetical protein